MDADLRTDPIAASTTALLAAAKGDDMRGNVVTCLLLWIRVLELSSSHRILLQVGRGDEGGLEPPSAV